MSQKVITVTGFADVPGGKHYMEQEFKNVTKALSEGYEVKQVCQSGSATDKVGWFIITFILEKSDRQPASLADSL